MISKRFLTPDELKEHFGFGKDWQAKRRSKSCPIHERIPFIKLGRFIRYDEESIIKWLEAHVVVSFEPT
jgi:predicted DNA-binding transcriptional regulator AlpA